MKRFGLMVLGLAAGVFFTLAEPSVADAEEEGLHIYTDTSVTSCTTCQRTRDGLDCPTPASNCLLLDAPWTDPVTNETYNAIYYPNVP